MRVSPHVSHPLYLSWPAVGPIRCVGVLAYAESDVDACRPPRDRRRSHNKPPSPRHTTRTTPGNPSPIPSNSSVTYHGSLFLITTTVLPQPHTSYFRASRAKPAPFTAFPAALAGAGARSSSRNTSGHMHTWRQGAAVAPPSSLRDWRRIWNRRSVRRVMRYAEIACIYSLLDLLPASWPAENLGAHRGLRCGGSVWGGTPLAYSMWKCANK